MGDSELRMPLTALPLLVMERAKRNAGAPLPKIPICSMVKYFCRGIVRNAFSAKGAEHKNEMLIRSDASSRGVKPKSPFLIRIYEVPQMTVRRKRRSQF